MSNEQRVLARVVGNVAVALWMLTGLFGCITYAWAPGAINATVGCGVVAVLVTAVAVALR